MAVRGRGKYDIFLCAYLCEDQFMLNLVLVENVDQYKNLYLEFLGLVFCMIISCTLGPKWCKTCISCE